MKSIEAINTFVTVTQEHLHRRNTRLRSFDRAADVKVSSQNISFCLIASRLCVEEFHDMHKASSADLANTQTSIGFEVVIGDRSKLCPSISQELLHISKSSVSSCIQKSPCRWNKLEELTAAGGERRGLLPSDSCSRVSTLRISHGMWAMRLHEKSRCRNRSRQIPRQEVKVIWQKAPIPRLRVTPGGRKLYHWIPGVGFPISVP